MSLVWWIFTLSVLTMTNNKRTSVYGATICNPPCLLMADTSDILAIDYQTSGVRSIISGLTRSVALDIHFNLGYIFWSDVTEKNIKRYRIDIGSTTTIITNIGVCDGLAVNWKTSQLYWSDTTNNKISIADLSGNNQRTLISSSLDEPRDIALDLDGNFMFWTDWGTYPKIERATLDGNQRLAILTTNLVWPNGIDLDKGNKRIFWADARLDRVESVDYNGSNRKLLLRGIGLHPFGVALYPPFLFFTDWNSYQGHKVDATSGKVLASYSTNGGKPMGIVTYDGSRQLSGSSPCGINNGGCSHFCIAKTSGRECVCPSDLTLNQDGKTCERVAVAKIRRKFILFADADAKTTNTIPLDANQFVSETLLILLGYQRPIALDYDPVEDRVYWTDISQGRIMSAFFNATSIKVLFRCNIQSPEGIAIDYQGRNMYWTDTGTNSIEVGRLDGTKRKLLIKSGLDEPRAVLLDERNGMMYWTDWGANPKIEKAAMDGSARQSIITGNLVWPNGLAIDHATNQLYWVDAKLDKIEMSNLNGGNRQLIMSSGADIHPFGLTFYQNFLYWTDWKKKSILRIDLSSKNQETVVSGLKKPMDVHIFDPTLMYSGTHACVNQSNGLCSDFCLLKPGGYQCACPTGISLKSDGQNCDCSWFREVRNKKFMIFAEANFGEIYKTSLTVPETSCYPLPINTSIARPVAIDYDPVEGKVYWTDVTLRLVARGYPNGSSVEIVASNNVDNPDGIAVDYIGRNLYWTDYGTSKLEVSRLDGSSRRILITSGIQKPRAIILHFAERIMYWTDWGSSPKIEQTNMDGSGRKALVSSGIVWVNSLALDYDSRLLYWCDAKLDKIERVDLQGNNRKLILDLASRSLHPFGLDLSDNIIYWSDWKSRSVHKYNMTSSVDEVFIGGRGKPMELHIFDQGKIFNGTNSCTHLNGGCSHLCLPNPHGYQCLCPEGVQLKPGDSSTCHGVNRCPRLFAPVSGGLEPCANLPGKTCKFFCHRGYVLTGSMKRTCNHDGTWSGNQTRCQKAVTCPALSTPANGIRKLCTGISQESVNTECLFSCRLGFKSLGSSLRRCLRNGSWSGQNFTCQAVTCPPLKIPPRALLLSDSCGSTYGSSCVFGCKNGFGSPSGNVTTTCLHTGEWSRNVTNCSDVTPPSFGSSCTASPLIVYAEREKFSSIVNWTEPYATDNTGVVPTLTSNYQPPQRFIQGSHLIMYSAVDQAGNKATCSFIVKILVINCTLLRIDPAGPLRMNSCGNHYGAQCNFTCPAGYRMNGSSVVTCLASGNRPPGLWDNSIPKCRAIRCLSLPVPINGVKVGCSGIVFEPYDSRCSFACNAGYSLVGSYVRRCLENETWSGETAYCEVIKCGPLVTPKNAIMSPSSCQLVSQFGQTCRITCQIPGYVLEGTSSRVCSSNGRWSGLNDTNCKDYVRPTFDKTCPKNLVIYTDQCSSHALIWWKEPIATDNSGHVSVSYPALRPPTNLSIGLYNVLYSATDGSGNKANCSFIVQVARKFCASLRKPPNGVVVFSCHNWFGSQASYSCDRGYRLVGSHLRSCQINGSWSGNATTCNAVKCPAIEMPPHGTLFPSFCKSTAGVQYGTHCFLSCNVTLGYRLEGTPRSVSCLENGSWSADTNKMTCRDVRPPSILCPPNVEEPTETGRSYSNVTWKVPVPTDNSNESLSLNGLLPPQKVNVGIKYFTYKATDSAGQSTSCTFSVHVIDTEPPKIASCPDDIHITSRKRYNKVYLPSVTVTDNVGIYLFTTTRPNGSEFTWGEHNITYTASDRAGNEANCHFQVIITDHTCPDLPSPLNGAKACETWLTGMFCTVHCNYGYAFVEQPQKVYVCTPDGSWRNAIVKGKNTPALPDCSKASRPKRALVSGTLHYLVGQCGIASMNEVIASNFIKLFKNSVFGMAGGCGLNKCTIDNVRVVCGGQTRSRRRRATASGNQTSNISLAVYFFLDVPIMSNVSLVDLNRTLPSKLTSDLKKANLNLNFSDVIIEYDPSKPLIFHLVRLLCDQGQVLRGKSCVNCPLGYFLNGTDCQACTVDQYQDQEAQTLCIPCPSGKSTFGKTASRSRRNCQDVSYTSKSSDTYGISKTLLYAIIAAGTFLFLALIIACLFFIRRHFGASNQHLPEAQGNEDTQSIHGIEQPYEEPDEVELNDLR